MPVAKKRQSRVAQPEIIVVRLKRYNPRRGHRLQRFCLFGYVFKEEQNWYKIPAKIVWQGEERDMKDYLENVHQDNEDIESPLAFDVVTEAEAALITKQERRAEQQRLFSLRGGSDPVDMTGGRARRSKRVDDGSERGDLTLEDVNYKSQSGRRKFPRSMRRAEERE